MESQRNLRGPLRKSLRPLRLIRAAAIALCAVSTLRAAGFPSPYNSEPPDANPPPPAEALAGFTLPEGFQISLFASEPDVQQPVAMTTDERGRLWVAECYTYAESAVNYATDLKDRILVLEDTDNDGRFDKRTVFWEGASKLTSIEVGFGGVWALCAPNLLFIPDRNRDDVPDGPPEVLLDGWDDDRIRHNIVNGLKWGPDGWLYGRHGITTTSQVGPPGTPREQRARVHCGIWRYHPVHRAFEQVAHGTTNPWGHDWDDHGQMFFINTVIGHLWHMVPGAHYERMYGEDFNPNLYELIPQTADHYHWDHDAEAWSDLKKNGITDTTSLAGGGHAHVGMMIYLGDNWPDEYRNGLFTLNLHGRRINHDLLARRGAGYAGTHEPDFMLSDDPWFRGVELLYGADGGVYIADWSDTGECHENDGVHRTSGRIYKVTCGAPAEAGCGDLFTLEDSALVALQRDKNEWLVRQARRLLQERAVEGREMGEVHAGLRKIFDTGKNIPVRLRALWALYVTGGTDPAWLEELLEHPSEHVRVWAIQFLVDRGAPDAAVGKEFASMAASDSSGLVQLYLASALQRLPLEQRWPGANALAGRREYVDDPMLALMIWYGIEAAVPSFPERAIQVASHTSFPRLRRFIARRLTGLLDSNPDGAALLVGLLEENPAMAVEILTGMNDSLRGRQKAAPPDGWDRLTPILLKNSDPEVAKLTRDISLVFGSGRAAEELRAIAADKKADPGARRNALAGLVQSRDEAILDLLRDLIKDRDVAAAAVRGLASFDRTGTAEILLKQFRAMRSDAQAEAVNTLAARPASAIALLAAVEKGTVKPAEVSAFHIRQMRSLGDSAINERLATIWPDHAALTGDKASLFARYRGLFTPERLGKADPARGRILFQSACASCHKLYGEGGAVGPDLTGSDRPNLNYLLENIIDPSATLAENYQLAIVTLSDGRILTGVIAGRDGNDITLQTITERLILRGEVIEDVRVSRMSLMPEGLLSALTEEQALNLFAYLMTRRQVAGAE